MKMNTFVLGINNMWHRKKKLKWKLNKPVIHSEMVNNISILVYFQNYDYEIYHRCQRIKSYRE